MTCEYMGCSTHNVPSWSKVAMGCTGGTNFGLDLSVVVCTNAMIACLAAPSFHDGRGSVGRAAKSLQAEKTTAKPTTNTKSTNLVISFSS